jgi:hypothetical protein
MLPPVVVIYRCISNTTLEATLFELTHPQTEKLKSPLKANAQRSRRVPCAVCVSCILHKQVAELRLDGLL